MALTMKKRIEKMTEESDTSDDDSWEAVSSPSPTLGKGITSQVILKLKAFFWSRTWKRRKKRPLLGLGAYFFKEQYTYLNNI